MLNNVCSSQCFMHASNTVKWLQTRGTNQESGIVRVRMHTHVQNGFGATTMRPFQALRKTPPHCLGPQQTQAARVFAWSPHSQSEPFLTPGGRLSPRTRAQTCEQTLTNTRAITVASCAQASGEKHLGFVFWKSTSASTHMGIKAPESPCHHTWSQSVRCR